MAFYFRLLDKRSYDEICGQLNRALSGDAESLESLLRRCRTRLKSTRFRRWHVAYAWLSEEWQQRLEQVTAAGSPVGAPNLAEIAVALCCMPEFQYSVHAAPVRSPNLVVLGDYDSGLYGALADADRWFDSLLATRFPRTPERYHVGDAMIVLEREEVERLADAASKVVVPPCAPPGLATALKRLRALVQRALRKRGHAISVSEFG